MQPSSPVRNRPRVKRVESEIAQDNQTVLATQVDSRCMPKEVSLCKINDGVNALTSTKDKPTLSDHGTSTIRIRDGTDKRRLALMSLIPQSRKSEPTADEYKFIEQQTSKSIAEAVRERKSRRNSIEISRTEQQGEHDEAVSDTNEKKAPPQSPVTNPCGTNPSETPQNTVTAANDPQSSKEYLSPKGAEPRSHRPNPKDKHTSTGMELSNYLEQGFSCLHSGDFRFTKFLQRAWDCPKDQLLLLDRPTSWQHPENGRESLKSNVPIALLKEFQSIAEQHRDRSRKMSNKDIATYKDQELVESQMQSSGRTADEKLRVGTSPARVELEESADDSVIEGWEDSPSPQVRMNKTIGILPDDSSGEESESCVTASAVGLSITRNKKAKAQKNTATMSPLNEESSISLHERMNKASTDIEMADSSQKPSIIIPPTNNLQSLNNLDMSIMFHNDGKRPVSRKSDSPAHIAEAAEDKHKRFGSTNDTVTSQITDAARSKETSVSVQSSSAVDNEAELSTIGLHTSGKETKSGLKEHQDKSNTAREITTLHKDPSVAIGSRDASAVNEFHLDTTDAWGARSPARSKSVAVNAPTTKVGTLTASDRHSISNSDTLDLESDGDDSDIEIIAPQAMVSNVKHIDVPYTELCYSTHQPYTAIWSTYTENAGGSGINSPNELTETQGHGKFPSPSNASTNSRSHGPKRKRSDAGASIEEKQEDLCPTSAPPPSSFVDNAYEKQTDRQKRLKNRHDSSHLLRFDDMSRDYSGFDACEDTTVLSTPSILVSSSQMWTSPHDAVLETLEEVKSKEISSPLSARHNDRRNATQSSEQGHAGTTQASNDLPYYSQESNESSVGVIHSSLNEMDTDIEPSSATFLAFDESQGRVHAVEKQAEQLEEKEVEEDHDDDEVEEAEQAEQIEENDGEEEHDEVVVVVAVEQIEQEEEPWSSRDTPFNRWARDFRELRIFGNVLSASTPFSSSSPSSPSVDVSLVAGQGNAWAL